MWYDLMWWHMLWCGLVTYGMMWYTHSYKANCLSCECNLTGTIKAGLSKCVETSKNKPHFESLQPKKSYPFKPKAIPPRLLSAVHDFCCRTSAFQVLFSSQYVMASDHLKRSVLLVVPLCLDNPACPMYIMHWGNTSVKRSCFSGSLWSEARGTLCVVSWAFVHFCVALYIYCN